MTDSGEQALAFLRALSRLPAYTGIVFHGLPDTPILEQPRWTRGVIATSRNPLIATENFATPVIAAIVSRSGRDISAFSAHPDEDEVVIPPEVLLQEVGRTVTTRGTTVVVLEQLAEVDPDAGLPPTLEGLLAAVDALLADAQLRPAAEVTTPGKFVERIYFAEKA